MTSNDTDYIIRGTVGDLTRNAKTSLHIYRFKKNYQKTFILI